MATRKNTATGTITTIMTTDGSDGASLTRLLAWLSPAFPIGAFSYSHGLERAVHDRLVADSTTLANWLGTLIHHGSGWNDTVLLAEAWRRARDGGEVAEVAQLGEALAGSAERHMETMLQGAAFLEAVAAWQRAPGADLGEGCPYPVAVGWAAGTHGVALEATLAAFLQAFVTGQTQAGIRLGIAGQGEALAIIAGFESAIITVAARAARSSLDELGAVTLAAETAAMNHEVQRSRLFRA